MKKRKITYSLTAQQKKKLKREEETKGKGDANISDAPETEVAKKSNNSAKIAICISAFVLAAAMIVLAILIPIWINAENVTAETFTDWVNYNPNDPENPYTSENPNPNPPANPIATVKLTGDNKQVFKSIFGADEVEISVEIFMDDAPYAGMNFMYLAESGFYDGTIISDVSRGHAMFSGFTDNKNSSNRALESNVILKLKGFTDHNYSTWNKDNYKLGYRLTTETKRSASGSQSMGYLTMMAGSSTYYSTSTSFMFITSENPQFNFADDSTSITSYLSWLGRVTDDESMQILRKFNNVDTALSGKVYYPLSTIRISSIKTNLSSARRKYLLNNFEELISGGTAITTWRQVAYNSQYYMFEE
ncbi:MAG: peptidylprolyl isomerase [Clostridiales bacterium]|nr:peptidylprolyl isomerase [Clostridiales bacterium]